jgi:hypothetical protein
MPQSTDFFTDAKLWVSIASSIVSVASLIVSITSAISSGRKAGRALAISESQEKRRQPQLAIYLANGYRRLLPKQQLFGFQVSISNPTDINNSVARTELQIEFLVENNITTTCRIQHNAQLGESVSTETTDNSIFSLPLRIDAHQTVSGWFLFVVDTDVIRKGTIDAHSLILEDSHGAITKTAPIMVREWIDESQKN